MAGQKIRPPPNERERNLGSARLLDAMREDALTREQVARKLRGSSAAAVQSWLDCARKPCESARKDLDRALGIPAWAWDRVYREGDPLDADPPAPLPQRPPMPDSGDDAESGLQIARTSLARIRSIITPDISPESLTRITAQEAALAKTIASLSGELSQSELAAFKRTQEFDHFINIAADALRPFPEAARALFRALGVVRTGDTSGDDSIVRGPQPPEDDSLRLTCERIEQWLANPSWDPIIGYENADRIVYPIAGWEEVVAEKNHELARRVVSVLDSAMPRLESSTLAWGPQLEYFRRVITRLDVEAKRGQRIAEFRRDFGEMPTERAKQAFGR